MDTNMFSEFQHPSKKRDECKLMIVNRTTKEMNDPSRQSRGHVVINVNIVKKEKNVVLKKNWIRN